MEFPEQRWFREVDPPWACLLVGPESELDDYVLVKRRTERDSVVRLLRGRRCATPDGLFQEWAAALQFPWYFGHNWNALSECLRDLEWLPGARYLFCITQLDAVLAGGEEQFGVLMRLLDRAAREWATPVLPDSEWPRPAVPFRLIFHCEAAREVQLRGRLQRTAIALLPRQQGQRQGDL